MIRALSTAASGMEAQQQRLDGITNNLANVNTTAFKKDRVDFQDLLYQTVRDPGIVSGSGTKTPTGIQVGTGVKVGSIHKEFAQGPVNITSNPTDLMINGDGFFAVQRANGEVGFTRNGSFQIDKDGRLMTKHGELVQPAITVPTNRLSFNVGSTGVVTVLVPGNPNDVEVGKLEVFNFVNPGGLSALGGSLYSPTTASGAPVQSALGQNGLGFIEQGALEAANVNVVTEMTDMIKTQRSYEMNAKVMNAASEMLSTVNNLK